MTDILVYIAIGAIVLVLMLIVYYWEAVKKLIWFIVLGFVFGFVTDMIAKMWIPNLSSWWILVFSAVIISAGLMRIRKDASLDVLINK